MYTLELFTIRQETLAIINFGKMVLYWQNLIVLNLVINRFNSKNLTKVSHYTIPVNSSVGPALSIYLV